MAPKFPTTLAFVLLFVLPWTALCSDLSGAHWPYRKLGLRVFLSRFAENFEGDPETSSARLTNILAHNDYYEALCFKYLVSSVILNGYVEEKVLQVMNKLGGRKSRYMSDLMKVLNWDTRGALVDVVKNALTNAMRREIVDAMSEALAENVENMPTANTADAPTGEVEDTPIENVVGALTVYAEHIPTENKYLDPIAWLVANDVQENRDSVECVWVIAKLARKNWSVMGKLVLRILAISQHSNNPQRGYYILLRCVPLGMLHEKFMNGQVKLNEFDELYRSKRFDPSLRELFFLNRFSRKPNLEFLRLIAKRDDLASYLLPDYMDKSIEFPNTTSVSPLTISTLRHIYPKACLKELLENEVIQDLISWDLRVIFFSLMPSIAPWSLLGFDRKAVLTCFGRSIVRGILSKLSCTDVLLQNIREYWELLTQGQTDLPAVEGHSSPYETFMHLFGLIYSFFRDPELLFDKPAFVSEQEYYYAVRYILCKRKWLVTLPDWLLLDRMPELFHLIKRNRGVMANLLSRFMIPEEPCFIFIQSRHENVPPETLQELRELLCSRSAAFKEFARTETFTLEHCYEAVLASDTILPLLMNNHFHENRSKHFAISLILHFQNEEDKIGRIVEIIAKDIDGYYYNSMRNRARRHTLRQEFPELLADRSKYSPEDADFVEQVLMKIQ